MRYLNPTVRGFIKKELTQVFRDKQLRILLIVPPLIQMLAFGYAISTQTANIRLATVYPVADTASRLVAERCYASGWFIPTETGGGDPFEWVRSGKADAVMIAPREGLSRALGRGEGKEHPVQLLVNASNINKAQSIENYFRNILTQQSSETMLGGAPKAPLSFNIRYLYNPEMRTSWFMVPGVLCMVISIITILLTAVAVAREKEQGTFEALLSAPVATWEILLGKSISYILLGLLELPLVLCVAIFVFKVPLQGNFWALMLAALAFICNTVACGILLSTVTRNMAQVAMAGFLVLFPAVNLSGVMYPVENMPTLLRFTAYLNPLMYFTNLLRNIMLKGGDLQVVLFNTGMLILLGAVAVFLSFKRFHETLD